MKSTVVDESLSSFKPMYCSREYQASTRLIQQYEKSTLNLKLDKQSSYLTTFACLFGRYRYKHLPFRAVPVGDMFQHKIDEIFNDMPNAFGIADNILVIGYNKDRTDYNEAVYNVLRWSRM